MFVNWRNDTKRRKMSAACYEHAVQNICDARQKAIHQIRIRNTEL